MFYFIRLVIQTSVIINLPGAACALSEIMVTTKNTMTKSFVAIFTRMMICY